MNIRIVSIMLIICIVLGSIGYISTVKSEDPPFVLKWSYNTGQTPSGGLGPLAVDINSDGIKEIFVNGATSAKDKIFCFNGKTGALIWSNTLQYAIAPHNPMMIYDLQNNGDYEIIQPSPSGMMVFHAENGALLWSNVAIKCSEAHQIVVDTDNNNKPYIYTCNADANPPYTARLRKINGRTGEILISKQIYYSCHGGLSAADVTGDGDIELFLSERSYGLGKGISCWDAATLNVIWYRKDIFCSSHLPVIIDVNKDGILDVVISQQRDNNAGLYCLDGRNGQNIPGKCQDSIPGLPVHEAFAVYDIDNDGNLELSTTCYTNVKVFDIGKWQIEATLAYDGKPPYYANVMGGSGLEIIISEEVSKIKIYSNSYQLLYTINTISYASTVNDIDGDEKNELITISNTGMVKVYDTLATASSPSPRSNTCHYSERNLRTAKYIPAP
jgi:hypothetical protein